LGAGEPLLGLPTLLPYPHLCSSFLPGEPADWYDPQGVVIAPFKLIAMLAGLVLLPLVSRLTAARWPARALMQVEQ
jgi:hypothetical protein